MTRIRGSGTRDSQVIIPVGQVPATHGYLAYTVLILIQYNTCIIFILHYYNNVLSRGWAQDGRVMASLMPVVVVGENKQMCRLMFACETAWWWLGADGCELTWVGDNTSISCLLRADIMGGRELMWVGDNTSVSCLLRADVS